MTTCRITDTALATIITVAPQSRDGRETGGILLGLDHADQILITAAGTPGPKARRARHSFHRDIDHASRLADAAWCMDRSQWIGEWHTHPSGHLAPSKLDLTSYLRHLHDIELQFNRFIAIIAGLAPDGHVTIQTWIFTRTRIYPHTLTSEPSTFRPNPMIYRGTDS